MPFRGLRRMKVISKNHFKESVNELIKNDPRRIIGVKNKGEKYIYGDLQSADELKLDYDITLYSLKKYFFVIFSIKMAFFSLGLYCIFMD